MSALLKNFEQIWAQLRSQRTSRANHLEDITLKGLRGIRDLRVPFSFPVTVLAGANGCGKSTVLFALACAYEQREAHARRFSPTALFPDFRPSRSTRPNQPGDERHAAEVAFSYVHENQPLRLRWGRTKDKWNRSFFGMKRGQQPNREVYLRTLASLSNPSELRSVLQLAQRKFEVEEIDASNIAFAQRILSFRYSRLSLMTQKLKSVLFAERGEEEVPIQAKYSEFHMSAGERAVLRLSISISKMQDALVLIDEVEASLHPYIQQLLMLELQRLALRNKLQIVVTTHSPVILETVPPEARVFLERSSDNVVRKEAYRDVIQKALYGRSQNTLSLLCEDEEAEMLVRGILDDLGPRIDWHQSDIEVGRDTGKEQFVAHLETLGRFRKLHDVVFVLDGDGRHLEAQLEARATKMGQNCRLVFLPGSEPPEQWLWTLLSKQAEKYGPELGLTADALRQKLVDFNNLYASAADKPTAIAKNKLSSLALDCSRSVPEMFRLAGRIEASQGKGDIYDVMNRLQEYINAWRSGA